MGDPYREPLTETHEAMTSRMDETFRKAFEHGPTSFAIRSAIADSLRIDRDRVTTTEGLRTVAIEIHGSLPAHQREGSDAWILLRILLERHRPATAVFNLRVVP